MYGVYFRKGTVFSVVCILHHQNNAGIGNLVCRLDESVNFILLNTCHSPVVRTVLKPAY